jgi:hypothetical protein
MAASQAEAPNDNIQDLIHGIEEDCSGVYDHEEV